MHRLFAVVAAFLGLGVAFASLVTTTGAAPDPAASARAPQVPQAPQADTIDLYMSQSDNGPRQRGFPANTSQVYAVLTVGGAANERFLMRQRDLSGITVKEQRVGPLSDDRTVSMAVSITDFVNAYRSGLNTQTAVVNEKMDETVEACKPENIPPVPPLVTPVPPTPVPGQPTATPPRPDPYGIWMLNTLESVEIARTATADVTRTLQAILTLPDVQALPAANDNFKAAQAGFRAADSQLATVAGFLKPNDPTVLADPTAGCNRVRAAKVAIDQSMVATAAGWAAVPADTSTWRIPPTGARYTGTTFMGCQQYNTDVYGYVGDRPQDTASKSASWSVGDAGPPALVFTGPDLADRSNLNVLDLSLPAGASAIFAKSVTVPGTNHIAKVSAYVTDRMCNPVDGATLVFSLTPAGAGTISPLEVSVQQGVPVQDATLQAGDDAVNSGLVTARVKGVDLTSASGSVTFQVVGPADRINISINPDTLNLLVPDNIRAGIGVSVRDKYGRNVADGTKVQLRIADGDPGLLAYNQDMLVDGRIKTTEVVVGKATELVTASGYGQIPPSEDPGVQNTYLHLLADAPGSVTLSAEADGKTVNTNVGGLKTIHIIRKAWAYLPLVLKGTRLDEILVPKPR
jgi:hypothetical protein